MLLARSEREAEGVCEECMGLKFNSNKNKTIIFNKEEKPEMMKDIVVGANMKYLGLSTNEKNGFKAQRSEMLKDATQLAPMTHLVIIASRSRAEIITETTYRNSVNRTNSIRTETERLRRVETGVHIQFLGAASI